MNVSIVIPNYNGATLLESNLPAVFTAASYYKQQEGKEIEVIVADDASTDNSKQVLENFEKNNAFTIPFTVILHTNNRGFSSNVNSGVDKARGDILVLLNTDIHPKENFLLPLLDHFNNPDIFAVGILDESIEGEEKVLRGRGLGKWQRGLLIHRRGEVDKTNTLWVSGGSGAFRKKIWDKLHGLLPLYNPFYWEDIDLSYRAQKIGYKVLFEPKSVVTHYHEKGSIRSQYTASHVQKIAYRNQFYFIWINITDSDLLLSHLCWLPYHFCKALVRGDVAFFRGFFQALMNIGNVIKYRNMYKSDYRKKDKDILSNNS